MRCLLIPLLFSVAHGQLIPELSPNVPEPEPIESLPAVRPEGDAPEDPGAILIENLKGVVLDSWEKGGIRVLDERLSAAESLLIPSARTLSSKLEAWIGKPLTESGLLEMADMILIHYDREGYPVVLLDVPDQDFGRGDLRFQIEVGRIGEAGVTRPAYGSPDVIRKGLRLKSGEKISRMAIDEQMGWYGRSIFRSPKLYVSPGEEIATADLLIGIEERKPWQVTVGYENNGTDLLGKDRFTFGAIGMTKCEHLIAWQTSIGAPASTLHAHSLHWEIPFHQWHQSLILDASYAEVNSLSLSGGALSESEGTSWAVAAAQRFHIVSPVGWRQSITAGFELKSTDQFALFGAISLSPGEVKLLQAKVDYELGKSWENGSLTMVASLVASPGGLIDGNDDADFQAYDPQAKANYHIARLFAQGWWSPGADWRLAMRGNAQVADTRLLPAEQIAAGGASTVRGVAEREYFADDGWFLSFEAYSPAISPLEGSGLRLLGFIDHAWLKNRGGASESLSGAGVGVRMKITEWVDFRLDHGWRLDDSGSRSHVGVFATF